MSYSVVAFMNGNQFAGHLDLSYMFPADEYDDWDTSREDPLKDFVPINEVGDVADEEEEEDLSAWEDLDNEEDQSTPDHEHDSAFQKMLDTLALQEIIAIENHQRDNFDDSGISAPQSGRSRTSMRISNPGASTHYDEL